MFPAAHRDEVERATQLSGPHERGLDLVEVERQRIDLAGRAKPAQLQFRLAGRAKPAQLQFRLAGRAKPAQLHFRGELAEPAAGRFRGGE